MPKHLQVKFLKYFPKKHKWLSNYLDMEIRQQSKQSDFIWTLESLSWFIQLKLILNEQAF